MAELAHSAAAARPPRRVNRRGQGQRLRQQLLESAAALIEETGEPRALSLRAVAARVGVSATSVYLHFADADQLKIAVAQRAFADFVAVRDTAAAGLTDPLQALVTRCQAYTRYALDHPGSYRLMTGPELPALAAADDTTAPSTAALHALTASITACHTAGVAPTCDPTHLAVLLWTALHGQISLRANRPAFPWTPVEIDIEDLVHRILRVPDHP